MRVSDATTTAKHSSRLDEIASLYRKELFTGLVLLVARQLKPFIFRFCFQPCKVCPCALPHWDGAIRAIHQRNRTLHYITLTFVIYILTARLFCVTLLFLIQTHKVVKLCTSPVLHYGTDDIVINIVEKGVCYFVACLGT